MQCYGLDIVEPSEQIDGYDFNLGNVFERLPWPDHYFDFVHMGFLISVIPVGRRMLLDLFQTISILLMPFVGSQVDGSRRRVAQSDQTWWLGHARRTQHSNVRRNRSYRADRVLE